jgi:hypothetical protein
MKDDFSQLLCDSHYKQIKVTASNADPVPGQLVMAHTVYPPPAPWIVKVLRYDASDHTRSLYQVKRYEEDDRSHMPIAELQLRKDENYYVYIGKERPLVVVGAIKSKWGNPLKPENLFVCVPVFSFKPRHTDEFRIETIGFRYPNLFYLPSDPNGCSESSVARFELAQPISRQALHNFFSGFPLKPTALSDEAFALFLNHLGRFWMRRDIDKVVCEQIDIYRDLVLDELAKIREKP